MTTKDDINKAMSESLKHSLPTAAAEVLGGVSTVAASLHFGCWLRRCPFCGSPAMFKDGDDEQLAQYGAQWIECVNKACGASTQIRFGLDADAKPALAEMWNRRIVEETVIIEPHDRDGAILRYAANLTANQRKCILDAPESALVFVRFQVGLGSATAVEIVEEG